MPQKNYKYRINEHLRKMSVDDFQKSLKLIPAILGISHASFNNYRKIELGDKKDIPHEVVDKLEKLFCLQPGQLQNFTTEVRPIGEMTEDKEDVSAKYGLDKPENL